MHTHNHHPLLFPERKQSTGSLAVKDLGEVLASHRSSLVESDNLTTLVAAVPRYHTKDWLESYDKLSQYVVPKSSRKVAEDNEYVLFTVVLFRRSADAFKAAARDKGFIVRDPKAEGAASASGAGGEAPGGAGGGGGGSNLADTSLTG